MKRSTGLPPTRREVVGALGLAAVATVCWSSERAPEVSAARIRPGAAVTLRCAGADAYELRFGGGAVRRVAAPGGHLVFAAPTVWRADTWTALTALPLAAGRPLAEAAEVAVFTRRPVFGA